jgi:hypothetical protein
MFAQVYQIESVSHSAVFFSHNKSASAAAAEIISRTRPLHVLTKRGWEHDGAESPSLSLLYPTGTTFFFVFIPHGPSFLKGLFGCSRTDLNSHVLDWIEVEL